MANNGKSGDYHTMLIKRLKEPALQAAYLNEALKEGDQRSLLTALRNVAEANGGMRKLAEKTKLSRENLYRTLSARGNPELSSLDKIFKSMGLGLRIVPLRKHAHAH